MDSTQSMSDLYWIETYGCQMNTHDSEKLAGMLEQMGMQAASGMQQADVIVFNTCCIRDHAETKVFGNVGALRERKKDNPSLIIVVCGCMMQQEGQAQALAMKYPFVDVIFGTHNIQEFPQLLERARNGARQVEVDTDSDGKVVEGLSVVRTPGVCAYTSIMFGCNNYCSYCVVPFVRGRERSRAPADILMEIRRLVDQGYREVTLLGQNVNSYGQDCGQIRFAQLLEEIEKIDGLWRIRFMTSHPKDLSDDLIHAMAQSGKICRQLHLPVQSGDDQVLERMNRRYTRSHYLERVQRVRDAMPDIALSTDIIVGFPSETQAQYEQTISLLQEVRFDAAFTFAFSARKGTAAAELGGQLSKAEKAERLKRLIALQERITLEKNQELVGSVQQVLVQSQSVRNPLMMAGKTSGGKTVNFAIDEPGIGQLIPIRITQAKPHSLMGERV